MGKRPWNTATGLRPLQDPDCREAMRSGIRCAVCWHGNLPHGYGGNGLCAAHIDEDFNEYTQILHMDCGACGGTVKVILRDWRRETSVPCPHCSDGGIDLEHARRHANDN